MGFQMFAVQTVLPAPSIRSGKKASKRQPIGIVITPSVRAPLNAYYPPQAVRLLLQIRSKVVRLSQGDFAAGSLSLVKKCLTAAEEQEDL